MRLLFGFPTKMSENEIDYVTEVLDKIIKGRAVALTVAKKALKQYRTKAVNTSLRKVNDKSIAENGLEKHVSDK